MVWQNGVMSTAQQTIPYGKGIDRSMSTTQTSIHDEFDAFHNGALDGAADAADGVYLPTWSNPWIDESHGCKVLNHELASAYADGYVSAHAAIPVRNR